MQCDGGHPQLMDLFESLRRRQVLLGLRKLARLGKLFSQLQLFVRQSLFPFTVFLTSF